jgi:hypothetical protein
MAALFTQADVTRAIRGAQKAKMEIAAAEIDPRTGAIRILFKLPEASQGGALDQWRATHGARSAQRA